MRDGAPAGQRAAPGEQNATSPLLSGIKPPGRAAPAWAASCTAHCKNPPPAVPSRGCGTRTRRHPRRVGGGVGHLGLHESKVFRESPERAVRRRGTRGLKYATYETLSGSLVCRELSAALRDWRMAGGEVLGGTLRGESLGCSDTAGVAAPLLRPSFLPYPPPLPAMSSWVMRLISCTQRQPQGMISGPEL